MKKIVSLALLLFGILIHSNAQSSPINESPSVDHISNISEDAKSVTVQKLTTPERLAMHPVEANHLVFDSNLKAYFEWDLAHSNWMNLSVQEKLAKANLQKIDALEKQTEVLKKQLTLLKEQVDALKVRVAPLKK